MTTTSETSTSTTTPATTTTIPVITTTTLPIADHVVFSEIFYDTPGNDTNEEWIELYNPTWDLIDLSGLTIENDGGNYQIPDDTIIYPDEAFIIAGDSDFIPAVCAAKAEGTIIYLVHGETCHDDLLDEADERIKITPELISSSIRLI